MIRYVTRDHMKPLLEPFGLSEASVTGQMIYLGGQTGLDESHHVVGGGIKAQALQAFRNIKEVIEAAGGRAENIVHLTWYMVEDGRTLMEDAVDIAAAQAEILPGLAPPSTAMRVAALLTPEILIEIQTVAAL
jgi:enamine deaminase RidA (YjgF/YER057c/UK114 family)